MIRAGADLGRSTSGATGGKACRRRYVTYLELEMDVELNPHEILHRVLQLKEHL